MSNSEMQSLSTGRLNRSEPEQQFLPGTFGAAVLARQLKAGQAARDAAGNPSGMPLDFSALELRNVSLRYLKA